MKAPGAKGRFDDLLFVTSSVKLRDNIGERETDQALSFLQAIPNSNFIDLPPLEKAEEAAALVRAKFTERTRGVVLVGGYDVVPSLQFNMLSPQLLKEISEDPESRKEEWDVDDFIIWSDDVYGDRDNDFLPELPVSRIPDGRSWAFLQAALNAPPARIMDKYGIRNLKRPFAIEIFEKIPYTAETVLEVSEECSPKTIKGGAVKGAIYFMLHGHHYDATRYTGELKGTGYYEAFDIYNVPKSCAGSVVLSGCCYGALIALPKADRKEPGITLRSRTDEQSIALAFLKSGANAYVGCTGAHYSPRTATGNFFGKPMHLSFWKNIERGLPAAQALLEAKKEYAVNIPHGLTKAIYKAIEVKVMHQFTCLGIGW